MEVLGGRSVGRRGQRYSFKHPNKKTVRLFGCANECAVLAVVGIVNTVEVVPDEDELKLEQKGRRSHEMSVCKHGGKEQGAAVFVPR